MLRLFLRCPIGLKKERRITYIRYRVGNLSCLVDVCEVPIV